MISVSDLTLTILILTSVLILIICLLACFCCNEHKNSYNDKYNIFQNKDEIDI